MNKHQQPRDSQLTHRWATWRTVASLAVLATVAAVAIVANRFREPSDERFKRQVREDLPVGATREQVLVWAEHTGATSPLREFDVAALPPEPQKTLPELAGLSRSDLRSFIEVVIPCGSYRVWRDGRLAPNQMWVFIPLDEAGRVKGHYFLTLEALAEYERTRSKPGDQ